MEELRKIFSDAIHKGMNTSVSPIQIRINEIEDNCAIEAKKLAIEFAYFIVTKDYTSSISYKSHFNDFLKEYYVR